MYYIYEGSIPEVLMQEIQNRFEKFGELWPFWVQVVYISYRSDPTGKYSLSCDPDYRYRAVTISIYDEFFRDDDWESQIIHEMFHAYWAPYSLQVECLFNHFVKDPTLMGYIAEQLSMAEEGITEDFTKFARSLYLTNPPQNDTMVSNE